MEGKCVLRQELDCYKLFTVFTVIHNSVDTTSRSARRPGSQPLRFARQAYDFRAAGVLRAGDVPRSVIGQLCRFFGEAGPNFAIFLQ